MGRGKSENIIRGGRPPIPRTKELKDKIIKEIVDGRSLIQISVSTQLSIPTINGIIKSMGFEGFKDVRQVMWG